MVDVPTGLEGDKGLTIYTLTRGQKKVSLLVREVSTIWGYTVLCVGSIDIL